MAVSLRYIERVKPLQTADVSASSLQMTQNLTWLRAEEVEEQEERERGHTYNMKAK
jgi:hypothetical protein